MNGFGKNYALDYDETFLVGGFLRFADLVTFRAGLHHFSGHYGDGDSDESKLAQTSCPLSGVL